MPLSDEAQQQTGGGDVPGCKVSAEDSLGSEFVEISRHDSANAVLDTTARTSSLESDHPGDANSTSLRHPSADDWRRWRTAIEKRYSTQTAEMIVKSFRATGYHVTRKMLRDRLRAWGLNTKNTKRNERTEIPRTKRSEQAERAAGAVALHRPTRAVPTSPQERLETFLLNGLGHFFDRASERSKPGSAADGPDVTLLYMFGKLAADAYRKDDPASWLAVSRAADRVAQEDWSLIDPGQQTFLFLRCMVLMEVEWFQKFAQWQIWSKILTQRTPVTHPRRLMLRHILNGRSSAQLWDAMFALGQTKSRDRSATKSSNREAAMSRYQLASLLANHNRASQAEQVLRAGDALSQLDDDTLAGVHCTLGRTSFFQEKFWKATQAFRQARQLDTGSNPIFTVLNATYLAESLVRDGHCAEANEVLYDLAAALEKDATFLVRADQALIDLCDSFAGYAELADVVAELRTLRVRECEESCADTVDAGEPSTVV